MRAIPLQNRQNILHFFAHASALMFCDLSVKSSHTAYPLPPLRRQWRRTGNVCVHVCVHTCVYMFVGGLLVSFCSVDTLITLYTAASQLLDIVLIHKIRPLVARIVSQCTSVFSGQEQCLAWLFKCLLSEWITVSFNCELYLQTPEHLTVKIFSMVGVKNFNVCIYFRIINLLRHNFHIVNFSLCFHRWMQLSKRRWFLQTCLGPVLRASDNVAWPPGFLTVPQVILIKTPGQESLQ